MPKGEKSRVYLGSRVPGRVRRVHKPASLLYLLFFMGLCYYLLFRELFAFFMCVLDKVVLCLKFYLGYLSIYVVICAMCLSCVDILVYLVYAMLVSQKYWMSFSYLKFVYFAFKSKFSKCTLYGGAPLIFSMETFV